MLITRQKTVFTLTQYQVYSTVSIHGSELMAISTQWVTGVKLRDTFLNVVQFTLKC